MFEGSMVALVTPFENGKIDGARLAGLVQFQLDNGTDVLCPCGTTGESATLSFEEHRQVVEIVIKAAGGKVPVMAGTGSNNTQEAIMLTQHAQKAGADGCLLISPYYNKPTQEGLYLHFKAVAEAVDLPVVLYNVPSRTGVNMLPETVERLAQIKNIVGIKEASGSLDQVSDIINRCGDEFNVISGDDPNTLPMIAVGGKGAISVTANIAPRACADMVHAALEGRFNDAKRMHHELLQLHNAMFIQTNPIPVKVALGMMGKIKPDMRLPLCGMPDAHNKELREVLERYGLVK
ncbi:MAG: 4-hydroxy-tetrahydrodipicolinate synthase [Deltaproteobacteria bacterium]|nr:4-hydroxy-tetrahydrodipicolinate synthase [Deltaproteobacteria bacterium]